MASGHVNRVNRPNTWPQPTTCTVKKTLANKEPSTHGTSQTVRQLSGNNRYWGLSRHRTDTSVTAAFDRYCSLMGQGTDARILSGCAMPWEHRSLRARWHSMG